jgi:thiamine biosynthesis lipoprotein
MASRAEVRIAADDEAAARQAAQAAIDEVRRIEARFSRYRPDSIVSQINREAGGQAVEVDEETAALLDFGATLWQESEGRFDLTSGVLRRAWDFRAAQPPSAAQIDAVLPAVGWQQVSWQRPAIRLRDGMEIDFGGIGKEYATAPPPCCSGTASLTASSTWAATCVCWGRSRTGALGGSASSTPAASRGA